MYVRSQKKRVKPPRKITAAQSCENKDRLTKQQAQSRAYVLHLKDGARMQAYACRFGCCLTNGMVAWHVGHRLSRFGKKQYRKL